MFLAADDCLYDSNVVSNYVKGFEKSDKDTLIEMAQTAMYDESLTILESYYLRPHVRSLLEQNDSEGLYEALLRYPYLPTTSTFFKREVFKVMGKFNENYVLIEDVPFHFEIAKRGMAIHYENFIAIKHRHGGISHGQSNALSASKVQYYTDSINVFKGKMKEAKLPSARTQALLREKNYLENCWCEYCIAYLSETSTAASRFRMLLKHPYYMIVDRYLRWKSGLLFWFARIFFIIGLALLVGSNVLASSACAAVMPAVSMVSNISVGICALSGMMWLLHMICKVFESITSFDRTRLDI